MRVLKGYFLNLHNVLCKNESTPSSLNCDDLIKLIPHEIQIIPETTLGNFDSTYNLTKNSYNNQIMQLQSEFEDEQQIMIDRHEQRMEKITHKMYEVEHNIFIVENDKRSMQDALVVWKRISDSCGIIVAEAEALRDPSICSISTQWFNNFQQILHEKIVLRHNFEESFTCKSRETWFKDTERSINKVFRLLSTKNVISKLINSYEENISELKKRDRDTLLQIKQDNSQAMSNALKELHKLNLNYRILLNEVQAITERNKKELITYAVNLIACPLYKSAVSLIAKYDNGNFIEDFINTLVNAKGIFNPHSALSFLKSSAFESEYCLKVRGLVALAKILKLNLHHSNILQEVKNIFSIETQQKLSTAEGECFDLIEFDADILTRSSGKVEKSERCHHFVHCKHYEQFFVSAEAIFDTPLVDISCLKSEDVKWFEISENKNVKYLPMNVFRKFPNLEIYYAFKSGVVKINKNNFYGAEKLRGLWLNHNEIETIHGGSFDELKSLKWLYLGFNKLTSLDAYLFHNLKPLLTLSLENNRLTYLPPPIFYTLEELEFFSLDGNPVHSRVSNTYFSKNNKHVSNFNLSIYISEF